MEKLKPNREKSISEFGAGWIEDLINKVGGLDAFLERYDELRDKYMWFDLAVDAALALGSFSPLAPIAIPLLALKSGANIAGDIAREGKFDVFDAISGAGASAKLAGKVFKGSTTLAKAYGGLGKSAEIAAKGIVNTEKAASKVGKVVKASKVGQGVAKGARTLQSALSPGITAVKAAVGKVPGADKALALLRKAQTQVGKGVSTVAEPFKVTKHIKEASTILNSSADLSAKGEAVRKLIEVLDVPFQIAAAGQAANAVHSAYKARQAGQESNSFKDLNINGNMYGEDFRTRNSAPKFTAREYFRRNKTRISRVAS